MNNKVVNDVRAQGAKNQPKYKGVQKITEHVETVCLLVK
jgi:hypothetical protein